MERKYRYDDSEARRSLNVDAARAHLNKSPQEYYEIINRTDPEDYEEYVEKMRPLAEFSTTHPNQVLSVGVGSGLELHALRALFPDPQTKIVGL